MTYILRDYVRGVVLHVERYSHQLHVFPFGRLDMPDAVNVLAIVVAGRYTCMTRYLAIVGIQYGVVAAFNRSGNWCTHMN